MVYFLFEGLTGKVRFSKVVNLYKFYGHRFAYAKGGAWDERTGNVSPRSVLCRPVGIADDVNAFLGAASFRPLRS